MAQNKKLTIDDIAKELNISKTTVSRAISGKGRIGQKTVDKVMEYIKQNDYHPNALAKGLAQSRTFNIGFVMPSDYNNFPFFHKCMWGISTVASGQDYDVIISMVKDDDISQLARLIDNHKVDGIILGRTLEKDEPEAYLKSKGIPFVTVGSSLDDTVVQIDNDHIGACCELTTNLLQSGMSKIALVGGNMGHIVNQKRLEGYKAAFEKAGVPLDKKLLYPDTDKVTNIEKIVDELLTKKVECILCMDDSICSYVLNKLSRDHIRIPEDVKVASFYNSSLLAHNQPAITALQFDVTEMGMVCCSKLLSLIAQEETERKTLLGYEVAMRESTQV